MNLKEKGKREKIRKNMRKEPRRRKDREFQRESREEEMKGQRGQTKLTNREFD